MIENQKSYFASDLWALGVIVYRMVTNDLPFKSSTQDKTFEKIKRGKFEMPKNISTEI